MGAFGGEPLDVLVRRILAEELGLISSSDTSRWSVGTGFRLGVLLSPDSSFQFFVPTLKVQGSTSVGGLLAALALTVGVGNVPISPTQTLARGDGGGDYTTASTTFVAIDGTNLAVTITPGVGVLVRVLASLKAFTATGAVQADVALFRDGVNVCSNYGTSSAAGLSAAANSTLMDAFTGDGSAHTWDLRFKTANASDAATVPNSAVASSPSLLVVTS